MQQVVKPTGSRQISMWKRIASKLTRRAPIRGQDRLPSRGMWVVFESRTGILTDLEAGDVATVMLVDDIGHNSLEVHVPAAQVRQAYYEEIPEARRPEYLQAFAMGYGRKS